MSEQIDPLAPSHCVYGQAGERICGYTRPLLPAWCCHRDVPGLDTPEADR
ncbi:hypothetical protein [Mycolicibacterium setense]|nr:hypothetical protein [Mycolicibacterium setense]